MQHEHEQHQIPYYLTLAKCFPRVSPARLSIVPNTTNKKPRRGRTTPLLHRHLHQRHRTTRRSTTVSRARFLGSMGDLRAKLRAKFPRRHSGVPSLVSNRSTKSNKSNSSNKSESRPESECTAKGFEQPPASPAAAAADHGHEDSSHGGSGLQTGVSVPAAGIEETQARDKQLLRHGEPGKQESEEDTKTSTDVSDTTVAAASPAASPATSPLRAARTRRAAGSGFTGGNTAKNSTNDSSPRTIQAMPILLTPAATLDSLADTDHTHDVSDSDRRISTASRLSALSRINESTADDESRPTSAYYTTSKPTTSDPIDPATATSQQTSELANSASQAQRRPAVRSAPSQGRQSSLPSRQNTLIRTLLSTTHADDLDLAAASEQLLPFGATMVTRKIWVRRPGGSATMVTINEDDLVDDVRDMILRKYANSLGRQFDAPDLALRIIPREPQRQERNLGPEEHMARTLDAYFPGGQSVDEALVIDVPIPQRRTPRASPRTGPPHAQHLTSAFFDDNRPAESGTDYFGPGAVGQVPVTVAAPVTNGTIHAHSMTVVNTGQVPPIPSPGGTWSRTYKERPDRPRLGRQHTSSPTILNVIGAGGHAAAIAAAAPHDQSGGGTLPLTTTTAPVPPPLPTPPAPAATTPVPSATAPAPATAPTPAPAPAPAPAPVPAATPPPRAASPRISAVARPKKKKATDTPSLPAGIMLNDGVPPINVLIVEDNIINLRLLEAFVKRLKVRWQTAMNGREAVTKWRKGGFHLVLMDIQLPIMSGLEATREIRRLERVNSIGAFSSMPTGTVSRRNGGNRNDEKAEAEEATTASEKEPETNGTTKSNEKAEGNAEEDILPNRAMFKSPVIIVALTASSLQSDRHEALAAGCNDFLTKPVSYVWLQNKLKEWGCMISLIDFDGWRKWKNSAANSENETAKRWAKKKEKSEEKAVTKG
ncbi:Two-component response regulator SSK1p [Podospora bellae-mahoneyi]|uniref:Two-component response regulator SSK1p n=1 Tax=Podospora bellae-mahoneyi TaxID=2093777 RepID=A0ABR0G1S4_9PEZI|nr:Two-component response regulator SSK1p [Podospora bellae-mahoneyi]